MADCQKTNVYTLEQSAKLHPELRKCGTGFWTGVWNNSITTWLPTKRHLYSRYMPEKPKVIGIGDSRMETLQNI